MNSDQAQSALDHSAASEPPCLVANDVTVEFNSLRILANKASRNPLRRVGLLPTLSRKVAVKDASLVAKPGERIGIVGRNGSGKSTLLRAIAGLENVSSGEIRALSKPVLLGVNPALVPDRSGLENITLGLLAMGLTPDEARDLVPVVADMADLGVELSNPIRTYSSGMSSRLRFSIAASNPNTDILIIDEALGTGDAAFKERSEAAVQQIIDKAGTIFLVTHSVSTINRMCDRAIWMFDGRPIMDGPAKNVATTYRNWTRHIAAGEASDAQSIFDEACANYEAPAIDFR